MEYLRQGITKLEMLVAAIIVVAVFVMPLKVNAAGLLQTEDSSKLNYYTLTEEDITIISFFFDVKYYAANNNDVVKDRGDSYEALFKHFVTRGIFEGRDCCPHFNVNAYASAYPELRQLFGNRPEKYYKHFWNQGVNEGKNIITLLQCANKGITVVSVTDEDKILYPEDYFEYLRKQSYIGQQAMGTSGSEFAYVENNEEQISGDTGATEGGDSVNTVFSHEIHLTLGQAAFYYLLHGDNSISEYGMYYAANDRRDISLIWNTDNYVVTGENDPIASNKSAEKSPNIVGAFVLDPTNNNDIQAVVGYVSNGAYTITRDNVEEGGVGVYEGLSQVMSNTYMDNINVVFSDSDTPYEYTLNTEFQYENGNLTISTVIENDAKPEEKAELDIGVYPR